MQNITQSWFVQGMIKATTDAWLKGWDERNGGNLTLRLDDADIAPYKDNFHAQPRQRVLVQWSAMLMLSTVFAPRFTPAVARSRAHRRWKYCVV